MSRTNAYLFFKPNVRFTLNYSLLPSPLIGPRLPILSPSFLASQSYGEQQNGRETPWSATMLETLPRSSSGCLIPSCPRERQLEDYSGLVTEYIVDFHTLSSESRWNDKALSDAFHQGLCEEIKDELAIQDVNQESGQVRISCHEDRLKESRPETREKLHQPNSFWCVYVKTPISSIVIILSGLISGNWTRQTHADQKIPIIHSREGVQAKEWTMLLLWRNGPFAFSVSINRPDSVGRRFLLSQRTKSSILSVQTTLLNKN